MSVAMDPDAVGAAAGAVALVASTVPEAALVDLSGCGSSVATEAADEFALWRAFALRQLSESIRSASQGARDAVDAYRTADGSAQMCFADPSREF